MESVNRYIGEFVELLGRPRVLAMQFLALGGNIFAALMLWRLMTYCTACESPMVVVVSGSMEPGIIRGDILFLNLIDENVYIPGDIVVYKLDNRDTPIVHRIISTHVKHGYPITQEEYDKTSTTTTSTTTKLSSSASKKKKTTVGANGEIIEEEDEKDEKVEQPDIELAGVSILTKGDNNSVDDQMLYKDDNNEPDKKFMRRKHIVGRAFAHVPKVGMVTIILNDYPWLKNVILFTMMFFVLIGRSEG